MSKFKVGDVVLQVHTLSSPARTKEVAVTKVGRKYFYVGNDKTAYSLETGRQVGDYSHHSYVTTREAWERAKREDEAENALRAWGIETWRMKREYRVPVYEAVRHIFDPTMPCGWCVTGADCPRHPKTGNEVEQGRASGSLSRACPTE